VLTRFGLRPHLMQAFPKRQFQLLIDSDCVHELASRHNMALQFIIDLALLDPAIQINLLTPDKRGLEGQWLELIPAAEHSGLFAPANLTEQDPRKRLFAEGANLERARNLCALGTKLKVDGVVTTSPSLIEDEVRYALYQHDRINVVPLDQLADVFEVCAHGHDVYWSVSYEGALTHDVYYTLAHHKCQRLAKWWGQVHPTIESEETQKQLRSLVLNRYPFILYARDMVRFFQLQRDHFARFEKDRFSFPLSYHVNAFYLPLWGMLDQLCLIANHVLALGLDKMACGISRKSFFKALGKSKPSLVHFLRTPIVDDWIDTMSDFRHLVAHQVIPMPTKIVVETEESKKPREEILKIIEAEDPDAASLLKFAEDPRLQQSANNPDLKTAIEDQMVFLWRAEKVRLIADHMVLLEGKRGHYWRSPVVSVDHDLATLTAIMDAFLVAMFSKPRVSEK